MGLSLNGDINIMHYYNVHSPEDLRKIYDKAIGEIVRPKKKQKM
jgi:hypothetical protein